MKDHPFSKKQYEAVAYLEGEKYDEVSEVFFGGSAGGGKTFLGCFWQILRRISYPGTRGLIGRSKLKNLKLTTLKTFFDVWREYFEGKQSVTIRLNSQDNIIYFSNGSEIILKDLFLYPSDSDFASLGSLEITDAFYDEVTEITEKAYTIANSRIRYKLINGRPKSLCAGNPANNWVKWRFVMSENNGALQLEPYQRYISSTVDDNPDKAFRDVYKEQLEKLPYMDRQRLLYGDWTILANDNPFFYEFDYSKHVVPDLMIDPNYPVVVSFDFNNSPCSVLIGQKIPGKGLFYIKEYQSPKGTRGVLEKLEWLMDLDQPLKITGDNSGNSKQSSAKYTDVQLIERFFRQRVESRMKNANGSHAHSCKISNGALYNLPCYFSLKGVPLLINGMITSRFDDNEKLDKSNEGDSAHLVDAYRYMNNLWFGSQKDIDMFLQLITNAA
jgi:PBSX family phage terminase large subunit